MNDRETLVDLQKAMEDIQKEANRLWNMVQPYSDQYHKLLLKVIKEEKLLGNYTWNMCINDSNLFPFFEADERDDGKITRLILGQEFHVDLRLSKDPYFNFRSDDGEMTLTISSYERKGKDGNWSHPNVDIVEFLKEWGITKVNFGQIDATLSKRMNAIEAIKNVVNQFRNIGGSPIGMASVSKTD